MGWNKQLTHIGPSTTRDDLTAGDRLILSIYDDPDGPVEPPQIHEVGQALKMPIAQVHKRASVLMAHFEPKQAEMFRLELESKLQSILFDGLAATKPDGLQPDFRTRLEVYKEFDDRTGGYLTHLFKEKMAPALPGIDQAQVGPAAAQISDHLTEEWTMTMKMMKSMRDNRPVAVTSEQVVEAKGQPKPEEYQLRVGTNLREPTINKE